MDIPETIKLKETMHGSGINGAVRYQHRNDEFGVQLDAYRPTRNGKWTQAWTSDHISGREFKSYAHLRDAVLLLDAPPPAHPINIIDARHPLPGSVGRCYLCRGAKGPWTWSVRFFFGWRSTDVNDASSCDACLEETRRDPAAAVEARRKWVRENPIRLHPLSEKELNDDIPF